MAVLLPMRMMTDATCSLQVSTLVPVTTTTAPLVLITLGASGASQATYTVVLALTDVNTQKDSTVAKICNGPARDETWPVIQAYDFPSVPSRYSTTRQVALK